MLKDSENNGTEWIDLVTPTPAQHAQNTLCDLYHRFDGMLNHNKSRGFVWKETNPEISPINILKFGNLSYNKSLWIIHKWDGKYINFALSQIKLQNMISVAKGDDTVYFTWIREALTV